MTETVRPVRPELLAAKIEKIRNFEQPHVADELNKNPALERALWFLQFVSQPQKYPGGLSRFAHDLIKSEADKVGTRTSIHAKPNGTAYTLENAVRIFREIPHSVRADLFGDDVNLIEDAYVTGGRLSDLISSESQPEESEWGAISRSTNQTQDASSWDHRLLGTITPEAVRAACLQAAGEHLGEHLKRLCELPHTSFNGSGAGGHPWYFARLGDAVLSFIDNRAQTERSRLANTEITQLVTRWIEKSRFTKKPVMTIGNSRFGKTEAVEMYAAAWPGHCRLVQTPDSNAISDLLREVAKALGLEVGPSNSVWQLRERIAYVLDFSGLQLFFDECHFLFPGSFSRNSVPVRLNWVRRAVIDKKVPVVFVSTPQNYEPTKKRFVRATGFAMEQFDERILAPVRLPAELCEADLLAVARIHFPDLRGEYLQFVVDQTIATERNFVSDMEKIATLAYDNAREAGRQQPILADIQAAIAIVLPTGEKAASAPAPARSARPIQGRRKRSAAALPTPRTELPPSRIPAPETVSVLT